MSLQEVLSAPGVRSSGAAQRAIASGLDRRLRVALLLAKPSLSRRLGEMRWNDKTQNVRTAAFVFSSEGEYNWVIPSPLLGGRQLFSPTEFGEFQFREPLRSRIYYLNNVNQQAWSYVLKQGDSDVISLNMNGNVRFSWADAAPMTPFKPHGDRIYACSEDGTQAGDRYIWIDVPIADGSFPSTINWVFNTAPPLGSKTLLVIRQWAGGDPQNVAYLDLGTAPSTSGSYSLISSDYYSFTIISDDYSWFNENLTIAMATNGNCACWSHNPTPKADGFIKALSRWRTIGREEILSYDGALNPGPSGRLVIVDSEDPNDWWRYITAARTAPLYDLLAGLSDKLSYPNYKGGDDFLAPMDERDFKEWEQFWQVDAKGKVLDAWTPIETQSITHMRCIRSNNTGNAASSANDGQGCLFTYQEYVTAEGIVSDYQDQIVPADFPYETPDDWDGGLELIKLLPVASPGFRTVVSISEELSTALYSDKRAREVIETMEDTDHGHRTAKQARNYTRRGGRRQE